MISSKRWWLVVVGGERSEGGGVVMLVVPDDGGEGEETLEHAGGDAGEAAGGVAFEVEPGFEGVVDRFDDLAERAEEAVPGPGFFGLERGSDQGGAVVGEECFEFGGAVALVGHDGLAGPVGE